jgi:hypothetical protein
MIQTIVRLSPAKDLVGIVDTSSSRDYPTGISRNQAVQIHHHAIFEEKTMFDVIGCDSNNSRQRICAQAQTCDVTIAHNIAVIVDIVCVTIVAWR